MTKKTFGHTISQQIPRILWILLLTGSLSAALAVAIRLFPDCSYAQPIRDAFISDTPQRSNSVLTDNTVTTKLDKPNGGTIYLKSRRAVSGLYLEWDIRPESWVITDRGRVVASSQQGFVHEYVPLSCASTQLTLQWEGAAALCEVTPLTSGRRPGWVQCWQPPCSQADMLVISTHADDELLWFGGTLPYYAGEKQYQVQVAYMINHFKKQPVRLHELLNGLWSCGVRNYPIISSFDDVYTGSLQAAQQVYSQEDFIQFQVRLLRRFRPKVVIDQDLNGEYGHGAHQMNARGLLKALEYSCDSSYDPQSAQQYGIWNTPKAYLHLYPQNQICMQWSSRRLSSFGGKNALQIAREAYRCHRSQRYVKFHVEESGPYDCRQFGLCRSTVGLDVHKDDFFENIPTEWLSTPTPAAPDSPGSYPDIPKPGWRHIRKRYLLAGLAIPGIFILAILLWQLIALKRKKRRTTHS